MDLVKKKGLSSALLIWLFLLQGCGENMNPRIRDPEKEVRTITVEGLEGSFPSSDGEEISLPSKSDKPTVLMFASSLCGSCLEEAEELKHSFAGLPQLPSHFYLYTIVIYETPEDARIWKQEQAVPWSVGADPEGELFRKYCEKDETPCIVIHHHEKGTILKQIGKVPISKIKELVGPW